MKRGESNPLPAIVGRLWLWLAASPSCMASPNTFIFEVSNVVSLKKPSATVTLWAAFEPHWYAFRDTRTEVSSEFDRGWFSDPVALLNEWGHSVPGKVSGDGDGVTGIYIMQIYWPFSIFPEVGNPIRLWSVTWTTDDFTPRQVDLGTLTQSFRVYEDSGGTHEMVGVNFEEGSGLITVVPAPSVALVLAGAAGAATRRRRAAGA